MGIMVEWERVQEIAGEASVGRPHVAQALVEAGYVKKVAEAFDKCIGRNGPAYVEREKMTPEECVQCIVERGGLACWAHPADLGRNWDDVEPILKSLKAAGMRAMEVYYKSYGAETIDRLLALADKYELLPLGGSDYHGIFGNDERAARRHPAAGFIRSSGCSNWRARCPTARWSCSRRGAAARRTAE